MDLREMPVKKGDLVLLIWNEEPSAVLTYFSNFLKEYKKGSYIETSDELRNYFYANHPIIEIRQPYYLSHSIQIPDTSRADVRMHLGKPCLADEIYIGEEAILRGLENHPIFKPYAEFIKSAQSQEIQKDI